VILDLERFQVQARQRWNSLESLLAMLEGRPDRRLNPAEAEQLQELYAQVAADLNRVTHGALAPELRQYLERLVARAYAELYYIPPTGSGFWQWRRLLKIFTAFPETFRRQSRYFALAMLITLLGCTMGGLAVRYDPASVDLLLPADYLRDPASVSIRKKMAIIATRIRLRWKPLFLRASSGTTSKYLFWRRHSA